jgi:hypothetical protein
MTVGGGQETFHAVRSWALATMLSVDMNKLMGSFRAVYALGVALQLVGCDIDRQKIDGPYRLEAIDTETQSQVSFDLGDGSSIGRVPETVFAVGWDTKYIVAARHPHEFAEEQVDKSKTEYFYVIRATDGPYVDPSVTVRGPFNPAAFQVERRRLNLPPFRREIGSLK